MRGILRVMGIDPGTAIVGYGIIDFVENKYKVVEYGCIYTPKDMPMSKRLLKINIELEELLEKHRPDHIGIEDLFYFKNNKTVISVGQARGVIVLTAEKKGIPTADYTPPQVKMGITGYGKSDKKQVQLMVQRVLGLEEIPKPDDAADGLAIAVTHINALTSGIGRAKSLVSVKLVDKKAKSGKMTAAEFRKLMGQ